MMRHKGEVLAKKVSLAALALTMAMLIAGHGFADVTISNSTFHENSATLTNQWWPMYLGTAWTFKRTKGAFQGTTFTISAVGAEAIYGVNCLKVRFEGLDGEFYYRWFAQDTSGSIQAFKKSEPDGDIVVINSDDDLPNTYMPGRLSVGESWVAWSFDGHDAKTLSVESDMAAIGSYRDCLKIKAVSVDGTTFHYYKRGLGLIAIESDSGDVGIRSDL